MIKVFFLIFNFILLEVNESFEYLEKNVKPIIENLFISLSKIKPENPVSILLIFRLNL